jgi:endoglucanase
MLASRLARTAALLASVLAASLALAAPSFAGTANAGLSSAVNPLAGITWGGYHSATTDPNNDPPSADYNNLHDTRLLPYLTVPRFRWFGSWIPLHDSTRDGHPQWGVYRTLTSYIDTVTGGNRDVGVQIGLFRLEPFEKAVGSHTTTAAEQRSYKAWVLEAIRAMRDRQVRAAVVLQPDLPLAIHQPDGGKVQLSLLRWTVAQLKTLPYATTYLDAGSSDWESVPKASSILRRAGVAGTRGFALNLTHYDTTPHEVAYGRKLVSDLRRHGIRNMHFVVSTAMNGRGFAFQGHETAFHKGTLCKSAASRNCVTLGQPFTTMTSSSLADAYMWLGRGWYNNATIRSYAELLQLLRTSPWF